jgi:hypothetical protein
MLVIVVLAAVLTGSVIGFLSRPTDAERAARKTAYDAALMQAHSQPLQTTLTAPAFPYGKFTLHPEARYDVTARVMSTKRYRFSLIDHFVDVSPEDLALGWGRFADLANLDMMRIWQEDRFFKYRYPRDLPVPRDELISSLANTHIIPANHEVLGKLHHVGKGDLIHMTGQLVDVEEPGYGQWRTSLVRTDTGPGACEILWLETLEIVPEP